MTEVRTITKTKGTSEKDFIIAELRQQLNELRKTNRDYRGVNDEIFAMENRFKMLTETRE